VHSNPRAPWFAFAISLLICFGIWRWAETILLPSNTHQAQSKNIPIGNNSDLYPRWLGTRESLLRHRDPYSAEITQEMQAGFYGRRLDPSNPSDPKDQVGFAYPLYVVFLLAPVANLPFPIVLKIFQWLLLLSLAASVPLWMTAVGFRTGPVFTLAAMILAVSSCPAVSDYHLQNLAVLVVLMLAATAAAAVRGWLLLSGLLLALSTIKPQLSFPFIFFFLLWAAAQWRKRQPLVWSFAASLLALIVAANAVSPGWIVKFLAALRAYQSYAGDPNILQVLFPAWLATLATAVLIATLLILCWRWKNAPAGTEQFAWALAWIASVTLVVLPKLAAYSQPLLIPALLVLFLHRQAISQAPLLPRALTKGVLMCLLWQWGMAVLLALASLLIASSKLQPFAGLPEYTLLALPPITFLAVAAATGRHTTPGNPAAQRE
jgi:hypothetical protein